MRYSALGSSGIEVSQLGLGGNNFGWRLPLVETRRVVDAALDVGVNFIDTADMYGRNAPGRPARGTGSAGDSERLLGQVLAGRRDRVVLATKFGSDMGDGSPARGAPSYVRRALEASLTRLRSDYVDLLYYHRPDGITPLEDTLDGMDQLVTEGKVRALGCSNLTTDEVRQVGARICTVQNRYNLLDRDSAAGVIPACLALDVAFVPHSPLAGGLLSGKYRASAPAPGGARLEIQQIAAADADRVEALAGFANEQGHGLLDLALAWLASQPAIPSVIAGATSAEQVRANAGAVGWQLGEQQLAALNGSWSSAGQPQTDDMPQRTTV